MAEPRRIRRDRRGTHYVLVSAKDAPWLHGRGAWGVPAGPAKEAEERVTAYTDRLVWTRMELLRAVRRDPAFLEPLRGRALACPCPDGVRCPTDILLELLDGTPAHYASSKDLQAFRAEGRARPA